MTIRPFGERQHVNYLQQLIYPGEKLCRCTSGSPKAEFTRNDNARANSVLSYRYDSLSHMP